MLIKNFQIKLTLEKKLILREKEGFKIATMTIDSIWEPDFNLEAKLVYGTLDQSHPAVNYMFNIGNKVYIGGKLKKFLCLIIMIIDNID